MADNIEDVILAETTRTRYLNYALSVITSRALPDVPNHGMANEEQMIATKQSSFCCVIHSSSFFYTFILTQQSHTYQVAAFLMSTVRSTSGKLGSARPRWSVTVLMARTNDVYIGKPVPY